MDNLPACLACFLETPVPIRESSSSSVAPLRIASLKSIELFLNRTKVGNFNNYGVLVSTGQKPQVPYLRDTSAFPKRQTLRLPSAVILRRLQPPQK